MQQKLLFFSFVFIAGLSACNKNDPESLHTASVRLNGVPFDGELSVSKNSNNLINFFIRNYNSNGYPEEDLNISFLPTTPGKYQFYFQIANPTGVPIERPNAQLVTLWGGDAGCGSWTILSSDSLTNSITVDSGSNANEINGTFSVAFLKKSNCSSKQYPDTMRFTDGTFHFKF